MKRRSKLSIDPLETRAVPTNLFVSPISLAVTDAAGANAQDTTAENDAAVGVDVDWLQDR